jgi:hypothetical protein
MDLRTPEAPNALDNSGTRRKGNALSRLPRFPALGRLVSAFSPWNFAKNDKSTCDHSGTLKGVILFNAAYI